MEGWEETGGKPCSAVEKKFEELKLGGEKLGLFYPSSPAPPFFEAERRATAPGHCRSKEKKRKKKRSEKDQKPAPQVPGATSPLDTFPKVRGEEPGKGEKGRGTRVTPVTPVPVPRAGSRAGPSSLPSFLPCLHGLPAQPGESLFSLTPPPFSFLRQQKCALARGSPSPFYSSSPFHPIPPFYPLSKRRERLPSLERVPGTGHRYRCTEQGSAPERLRPYKFQK